MIEDPARAALRERVRSLYRENKNVSKSANEAGVAKRTALRWVEDLRAEQRKLDIQAYEERKDLIKRIREDAQSGPRRPMSYYKEKYKRNHSWLRRALQGIDYQSANGVAPAAHLSEGRKKARAELAEKARARYATGTVSLNDLAKELGSSRSTLSSICSDLITPAKIINKRNHPQSTRDLVRSTYVNEGVGCKKVAKMTGVPLGTVETWCHDLIQERKRNPLPQKVKEATPKHAVQRSRQLLSNEQVIAMRQAMRPTGVTNLKHYADLYGVSISTISLAVRGGNFIHLNDVEPPVTTTYVRQPGRSTKPKVPPEVIDEALTLVRTDPEKWSYTAVAKWLGEKLNRSLSPGATSVMLIKRDPSIKDVVILSTPKRVNELSPEEIKKRNLKKIQRAAELQRRIAEEDAFEALQEEERKALIKQHKEGVLA